MPLLPGPAATWPWWWTNVLLLEERFANIRQSAAYDLDKMPPPKNFWLDDDRLEEWYEEREALRKAYD